MSDAGTSLKVIRKLAKRETASSAANGGFSVRSSLQEQDRRADFGKLFESSPVPKADLLYSQLSLYLSRQELSRILALADMYRALVLETNGVLVEFGTCYGRTASVLTHLRGIFEPYNFTRKLLIFDTFAGLQGTNNLDGLHALARDGAYSSGKGYEEHLHEVLSHHESEAPIPHIAKFKIIKGDAAQTIGDYLREHPETIIAMAYFDFDIYAPTRACLEAIRPHLSRKSVLAFDELNCPEYPGETRALADVFGLDKCTLQRSPLSPWLSYTTCEGFRGRDSGD